MKTFTLKFGVRCEEVEFEVSIGAKDFESAAKIAVEKIKQLNETGMFPDGVVIISLSVPV